MSPFFANPPQMVPLESYRANWIHLHRNIVKTPFTIFAAQFACSPRHTRPSTHISHHTFIHTNLIWANMERWLFAAFLYFANTEWGSTHTQATLGTLARCCVVAILVYSFYVSGREKAPESAMQKKVTISRSLSHTHTFTFIPLAVRVYDDDEITFHLPRIFAFNFPILNKIFIQKWENNPLLCAVCINIQFHALHLHLRANSF